MKNKNMLILLVGVSIAMLGYGIALPVLPFYISGFGGGGMHLGLLVASYGIMQFLFAPFWGSLSDRVGRKKVLMTGMAGMSLAMLLFGFSTSLWMLYVSQLLSGALACAMFPAAMAYVGDSTKPELRSAAMGKIGAATGLGLIAGPGIGGLLASENLSTPFFAASFFAAVTFIFIFLGLSEEYKIIDSKRTNEESFKFGDILSAISSPMAFGLVAAFAVYFSKSSFSGIYGLFALERFSHGPAEVGSLLMLMSIIYLLAQGLIVGPLTRRMGEKKLINICFLLGMAGFLLMLIAESYLNVTIAVSVFIISLALLKPSALALISKKTEGTQGKAMGIAESYMSLGRIAGPLWAGMLFDINILYPFISGAIFLAVILTAGILKRKSGVISLGGRVQELHIR